MRWKALFLVGILTAFGLFMEITLRPSQAAFLPGARDLFIEPDLIASQAYMTCELAYGLVDTRPLVPGHCLIIPKRQVAHFEELTADEILQMSLIVRKTHAATETLMGPCDYLLLQKNGPSVGQSIPHVHIHYIPRMQSQKSVLGLTLHFAWPFHFKLSKEQLAKKVQEMKQAIAHPRESLQVLSEKSSTLCPCCTH